MGKVVSWVVPFSVRLFHNILTYYIRKKKTKNKTKATFNSNECRSKQKEKKENGGYKAKVFRMVSFF